MAQLIVGLEAGVPRRWKVGVQFTLSFGSPHETSRPAPGIASSARAREGNFIILTTVYKLEERVSASDPRTGVTSLTEPEQFTAELIIEILLKEDGVTKGGLESGGQIDIRGALGVK